MSLLADLNIILPELLLIVGAVILLILGVLKKNEAGRFTNFGALIFTLLALIVVIVRYQVENEAFNGTIDNIGFTSFIKVVILIASFLIFLMASSLRDDNEVSRFETPILMMLSVVGMMFMVSSNSLLTLYLSMEIMSLPSYVLAASNRHNVKSAEAGLKYFILGSLGSGLFLFGVSLIYGFTGYVNYNDIIQYFAGATAFSEATDIPVGLLVGLIFITVAVCFKISAAPFHMWTPDVYQGAPTIITAFFSSAPKIAAIALFMRLMLDPFEALYVQWLQILLFISIGSMVVGSFAAIMQRDLKRLLAYSSIGHVGFALAGLVSGDGAGIQGVLVYISIYVSMILGTFAIIMMITTKGKPIEKIEDLAGIAKDFPSLAFMLTVMMLSMAGIPPLAGFFAKFYVLYPVVKQQLFFLALVFVIMSVVSSYYYLKIVKYMYFDSTAEDAEIKAHSALGLVIVAALTTVFNLLFIFAPADLLILGERAAGIFIE